MNSYAQVIEILKNAKAEIQSLLTEPSTEHHRIKVTTALQQNIDYLALITGAGDMNPTEKITLGPATTIMGKPIEVNRPAKTFDIEPEEEAVKALRKRVDMAYEEFLKTPSVEIRREFDDIIIRGVAKKAKIKGITKDNPAVVDMNFIDKIKTEMIVLQQIEAERQEHKAGHAAPDPIEEAFKEPATGSFEGLTFEGLDQITEENITKEKTSKTKKR